jgi:hypothetical protein
MTMIVSPYFDFDSPHTLYENRRLTISFVNTSFDQVTMKLCNRTATSNAVSMDAHENIFVVNVKQLGRYALSRVLQGGGELVYVRDYNLRRKCGRNPIVYRAFPMGGSQFYVKWFPSGSIPELEDRGLLGGLNPSNCSRRKNAHPRKGQMGRSVVKSRREFNPRSTVSGAPCLHWRPSGNAPAQAWEAGSLLTSGGAKLPGCPAGSQC